MSLPDFQLDPDPEYVECSHHRWVYPLGGMCQRCRVDVQDDYADQLIQDRAEGRRR